MEHLPPWLRNVPLPSRPGESAGDAPTTTPDWLRELQREVADDERAPGDAPAGESGSRQASGATSWLAGLGAGQPPAEPAPPAEEQQTTNSRIKMPVGATDWLRSIGRDPDAPSEPLSEPLAAGDESGVPDWLRDLTAEEVARGVAAERPSPPAELPPAAPAAEDNTDSGVPEWLRDVIDADGPPSADPPRERFVADSTGAAAADIDVPAWLRDIDSGADRATPEQGEPDWLRAAPAAAAPEDAGPPDWLRAAPDSPAGPPLDPSEAMRPGEEAIPAWLREADEAPPAPPAAVPAVAGEEAIPAWLREADETPPAAPDAVPAAGEEEIPAWLREADEAPPAAPAAVPAVAGEEEIPAWLREADEAPAPSVADEAPAWLRDAPVGAQEAAPASPPQEPPPWLRDEPVPPARPADLPAWLTSDEPAASPSSDPGLPSWLRGVSDDPPAPPPRREPPAPPRPAPVAEEGESHSFLRGTELPHWLRLPEPELPAESASNQELEWLRRISRPERDEELSAALPLAVAVAQRPIYSRSEEQLGAIALLRDLTQTPYPAPVAAPAPAAPTALQRIGLDRVLYALLALALLLGLLLPQLTAPFESASPVAPGAAELGAALDALGPDDVVLVAYEWGAQRSAELRPLEQAILARLTAERTKLILVSTDMQGTLLSFDLREPLRAAGYNVEPDGREFGGRDYVLLGYRPGGELALRSLAQDLRGELRSDFTGQDASQSLVANNPDGTPRIAGVQDLAMILVLADQPQDVQAWMEQVRPAARAVPIAFVLPQEALALAQPYLRLPGVYHLAGQQGALALLASGGGDPASLARASGQLAYATVAFLVLLLLGAAGVAVGRAGAGRGGA